MPWGTDRARSSGGNWGAGNDHNMQECCCRVSRGERRAGTCSHSDSSLRGTRWGFSVPAARDLSYPAIILPVVLRAKLVTTPQLLAIHSQLQSCSEATPKLSYITKVLPAKGKTEAHACPLCSTTLASQRAVCSSSALDPTATGRATGTTTRKPYPKGPRGKQAENFLREILAWVY